MKQSKITDYFFIDIFLEEMRRQRRQWEMERAELRARLAESEQMRALYEAEYAQILKDHPWLVAELEVSF